MIQFFYVVTNLAYMLQNQVNYWLAISEVISKK